MAIRIESVTPEPTEAQLKAIEAALLAAWPKPAVPQRRTPSAWQFSRRSWINQP